VEETIRVLISVGFGFLLILLRLDARRFGVAEYLDEAVGSPLAITRRRLSWYLLGLAFAAAIVLIHPDANGQLGLRSGDMATALLAGLGYGALGVAQAGGVGLWRSGSLDLPDARTLPWGVGDAILTALFDEVAFRGVLLGFLLVAGLDPLPAILVAALVYALATRTGAPGGDPYLLVLALAIGLLGGWLTVITGGIGAALIGHAITRIGVFAFVRRPEPAWSAEDGSHALAEADASEAWQPIGGRGSGAGPG
jgi:membrane protease YdiL (CAAX protease family)